MKDRLNGKPRMTGGTNGNVRTKSDVAWRCAMFARLITTQDKAEYARIRQALIGGHRNTRFPTGF